MSAPTDRAGLINLIEQALDAGLDPLGIIEAAGLRVVPVEATEEMERRVNAHCDTPDAELGWTWPHWLDASPFAPPKQETPDAG